MVVGGLDHLLAAGCTPIKADFPVFEHPRFPGVQIALARGEKKQGQGYHGFAWYPAADLGTDLFRRDLTINSAAYHPSDGLIDPHNAELDIKARLIRHTSDAFAEDPLRTIRAARFAASFGYRIHPDTVRMMRRTSPELPLLSHERVREEFHRAMTARGASEFFLSLHDADCLSWWFPEVTHGALPLLAVAAAALVPLDVRIGCLLSLLDRAAIEAFGTRLGYSKSDIGRYKTIAEWVQHAENFTEVDLLSCWKQTRTYTDMFLAVHEYVLDNQLTSFLRTALPRLSAVKFEGHPIREDVEVRYQAELRSIFRSE